MFRGKPVRNEPGRISMEGVLDECCTLFVEKILTLIKT
jgi:hypothetical protein